jgi:hypothetical protein
MRAEAEKAILGGVPATRIRSARKVVASSKGKLATEPPIQNPNYTPIEAK